MSSGGGLFSPKRADGRADWRVIFDLVDGAEPGTTFTYDDLMEALEVEDVHRVYGPVASANRHLWSQRNRSLECVRGVGYRVLLPTEHEHQANRYRKQGRRKVSKAVSVIDAVDLSLLGTEERNWVVAVQNGMHMLARGMDSHARRIAKHDLLISSLTERVEKLEGK